MPGQSKQSQEVQEIPSLPPEIVRKFAQMAENVPDMANDAGGAMLDQILSAETVEQLDATLSGLPSAEDFGGKPLDIIGIAKAPSDYEEGLGFYLIVDAVVAATGEAVRFSTGSTTIVAQLVKAYDLDAFPIRVIPKRADKQTRSGYWPWSLVVEGPSPAAE